METNRRLKSGLMVGLLITLLVFIGGCIPAEGEDGGFPLITIVLVLVFGVFYFFVIRPQRRKGKEHQELLKELLKGDKVITTGGIYGQIESISQDSVVIKVESGATMRVARSSIVSRRGG